MLGTATLRDTPWLQLVIIQGKVFEAKRKLIFTPRSRCYCTDSPGTKVNTSLCSYDCKGAPNKKCGQGSSNGYKSVYGTGRFVLKSLKQNKSYYFRPKVKVNGTWTEWTEWSKCNTDCRKTRKRTCDNPTPMFGGSNCSGEHLIVSDDKCYNDQCCGEVGDKSDYIGCYDRDEKNGFVLSIKRYYSMTNCLCIGYCASKNFSLAALYNE